MIEAAKTGHKTARGPFDPDHRRDADVARGASELHVRDNRPGIIDRGAEYVTLAMRAHGRLRNYLQKVLGQHPDVSDLLQDIYLQIFVAGKSGTLLADAFDSYVMAVARNKAYDWLRHRKCVGRFGERADVDLDNLPSTEAVDTEDVVIAEGELELLLRAVDRLPARCRKTFVLRRFHGMSAKEVAKILACSENTVEQQLTRSTRWLTEYASKLEMTHSFTHEFLRRITRPKSRVDTNDMYRSRKTDTFVVDQTLHDEMKNIRWEHTLRTVTGMTQSQE